MAGKEKRRYIGRVDTLRDKFISSRKPKPREQCCHGEGTIRFFAHVKFCIVCCASLTQVMAPWALCSMEVLTVLLIYFLATSRSLVIHQAPTHYRFSYTHSLEDVVGICCTRAVILSLAYAIGQQSMHRPYMYASYGMALVCFPYIVVKTILFRYGSDGVASAAILALTGICSWVHVFFARRTVDWTRRRYQMGLAGFGMPWEEGEEAWLMLRRPDLEDMTKTSDGGGPDSGGDDLPAEMLADEDSRFVELEPGLKVHYKEVAPGHLGGGAGGAGGSGSGEGDAGSVGILLVHGFGGGVFAWRHVMEALAMQCHCRVVAFDRPAFGLTSRPKASDLSNPYTVSSQAKLVLQLCSALGLKQVVLVAHADGCLVTLRAAAISAGHYQQHGIYMAPQHMSSISAAVASAKAMAEQQHLQQPQQYTGGPSSVPNGPTGRSTSSSSGSSPKLGSGSPPSPAAEQYSSAQQQGQQVFPGAVSAASFIAAGSGMGSVTERDAGAQEGVAMGQLPPGASGQQREAAAAATAAAGEWEAHQGWCEPRGSSLGGKGSGAASGTAGVFQGAAIGAFTQAFCHTRPPVPSGSSYSLTTSPSTSTAADVRGRNNGSVGGASHHHAHSHSAVPGCSSNPAGSSHGGPGAGGGAPGSPLLVFGDVEAGCGGSGELDRGPSVCSGPPGLPVSTAAGAALPTGPTHRRTASMPTAGGSIACGSTRSSDGWEAGSNAGGGGSLYRHNSGARTPATHPTCHPQPTVPYVLGLVLLHPNLSGVMGPAFSRILARSKLGRSILRPLLRTEVGEIANRRAWHNTDKLTSEVLELYKAPLRVEGWDAALMETTRQRREACQGDLGAYCWDVQPIPALVLTGAHDRIVPPSKSEALAVDLPHARLAVLHDCGHLSHEEAPGPLLEVLVPFCGEALCAQQAPAEGQGLQG